MVRKKRQCEHVFARFPHCMQVIACPSNCYKCWSTCSCADRKHLTWSLGSWRKTIIKNEQTVVITAVGEALWLSGCKAGCSWSGRGFQLASNQRTITPGGSTSHPRHSPRAGFAKISITARSSNQYQSDPQVLDIPKRKWPLLSNKEIDAGRSRLHHLLAMASWLQGMLSALLQWHVLSYRSSSLTPISFCPFPPYESSVSKGNGFEAI